MKKISIIAGVAVLSLSAALLAGCGGGSSDSASASSAAAESTVEESTAASAAESTEAPAAAEEAKATEAPAATEEAKATEAPAEPTEAAKKEEPNKEAAKTEAMAADTAGEVTVDTAIETALADAGLKESDVVMKKAELDPEADADDVVHYDVDFYANDTSFEYDIDAATGAILKTDTEPMDAEDYTEMEALQKAAAGGSESTSEITEDKALEIALAEAGVSMDEITGQKIHLDTDDDTGITSYEIEFYVGPTEYSFEIDPATGAVLSMESEIDD